VLVRGRKRRGEKGRERWGWGSAFIVGHPQSRNVWINRGVLGWGDMAERRPGIRTPVSDVNMYLEVV
jgi:hypothetical protein